MKANKIALTQSVLKSRLTYNPDTGLFVRNKTYGRWKKGQIAGHISDTGYVVILINGVNYKAHRLAWLYMTGKEPKEFIDHINGIKSDNRFCNLREATHSENKINSVRAKNNTTGVKGVSRHKDKYKACIQKNGKFYYLGVFGTVHSAEAKYQQAAKELHGEFYR